MNRVPFHRSVRARFLLASMVLLLIPLIGFLFVRELAGYLREGQQQVATAAAKLVAASLSDRPEALLRGEPAPLDEAAREREQIVAMFAASDIATISALGTLYQPNRLIERLLNQSQVRESRIWVVDASGQVRALTGTLKMNSQFANANRWYEVLTRRITSLMLPKSALRIQPQDDTSQVLAQAQRAAIGSPSSQWRRLPDDTVVLSVATPIWQQDNVVAALVLEETDAQSRGVAHTAAESVMMITFIVFLVVFGVLVAFALQLTRRLTRLQREALQAVDPQGRIRGDISPTTAQDEIGALNNTLRAMVARQTSYNNYLEQLAGRLSHELRTPVAVVRSSLDNLRDWLADESARVYLHRADDGVARLSQMIARMSEATQLERMLQGAYYEDTDMVKLVRGCTAGYQQAFPQHRLVFACDLSTLVMQVVPDAIAQLLDKLVSNATDFAPAGSTIVIALAADTKAATMRVQNSGSLLPIAQKEIDALFDSLVSRRRADSQQTHLGLGLYIARLIAEHHGGRMNACNLDDGSGVVFTLRLPLQSSTR